MSVLTELKSLKTQDILLLCGELNQQEIRTAKALLHWITRKLEHEQQNKPHLVETLTKIETKLLSHINKQCPPETYPDRQAISILNQLETEETHIVNAVETLKYHLKNLPD